MFCSELTLSDGFFASPSYVALFNCPSHELKDLIMGMNLPATANNCINIVVFIELPYLLSAFLLVFF